MAMTDEQKQVDKKIDELLWLDWDPVGINDNEEARDEYQSCTPQIFSLKINGAEKETIAKFLNKIATDNMGLEANIDHCREIADKVINI